MPHAASATWKAPSIRGRFEGRGAVADQRELAGGDPVADDECVQAAEPLAVVQAVPLQVEMERGDIGRDTLGRGRDDRPRRDGVEQPGVAHEDPGVVAEPDGPVLEPPGQAGGRADHGPERHVLQREGSPPRRSTTFCGYAAPGSTRDPSTT